MDEKADMIKDDDGILSETLRMEAKRGVKA